MKYLFFDIECCDGEHICEFGYVLIDDAFNVIRRECITINPEHKFKLTGRKHKKDIELYFTEETYYKSESFPFYYNKIKNIINEPDCQIIGFSMQDDCKFLRKTWKRYDLEPVNFKYLEFQKYYKAYSKAKCVTSVEKMLKELSIKGIILHKSDEDSYAVMRALQEISTRENKNIAETLRHLKKMSGIYEDEITKAEETINIEKCLKGHIKAQSKYLASFISKIKKMSSDKTKVLEDKVVCINSEFQRTRFNEFLSLIKEIYLAGGIYSGKASECDIFVDFSYGENDERLAYVKRRIEYGQAVEIISLEGFLTKLNLNELELSKVQHLRVEEKKKSHKNFIAQDSHVSLGDSLIAKGIDWSKLKLDE